MADCLRERYQMSTRRKIYVASSRRNKRYLDVVHVLRDRGFDAYDFMMPYGDAPGIAWPCGLDWKSWTPAEYIRELNAEPAAGQFRLDLGALDEADACVLVLPCGRSAHLELGRATATKPTVILLDDESEPELMYAMVGKICATIPEVYHYLEDPTTKWKNDEAGRIIPT